MINAEKSSAARWLGELAESLENYLADHNRAYTLPELHRITRIKKETLFQLIQQLRTEDFLHVYYEGGALHVIHIGWVKKNG